MSYAKFKGSEQVVQIRMKVLSENLVQLYPPLPDADLTAGFEVLTREKGGKVFGKYLEYTTFYRKMEDGSIILSNDGSVYTPPDPPVYKVIFVLENGTLTGDTEQTPENYENLVIPQVEMNENYEFLGWSPEIPKEGAVERNITFYARTQYIPTLEEVKASKKAEISAACEAIIHNGIDVVMPDGTVQHFSLKSNDQINLFGKQTQLAAGATQLEYHQDGHPCKYYTAEEMQLIITAAMEWVSYHTTYCNSLNMWIAGATSKDEVNEIFYGADIPEEYQSEVLKDYLAKIMAEAEAAVSEANS